jgi:hypothetical protein
MVIMDPVMKIICVAALTIAAVFADGFAAFDSSSTTPRAKYRARRKLKLFATPVEDGGRLIDEIA